MRTYTLLLVILAAIAVVYPFSTSTAGDWYPIADIDNPHIQELGGWAVTEHLKLVNDGIKFSKVTSGEKQGDADVKYRLIIDAINRNGKHGTYGAVLIEERSNTRRLLSFIPAN